MSVPDPDPGRDDEDMRDTESKLLSAAASATLVDLRTGSANLDDPAGGSNWENIRQIRASVLTDLLMGTHRGDGKRPRAVRLRGARITGTLDLEAATLTCPLLLRDCYLDERVNLDGATAPAIELPGCHLPGLTARQLRTAGDLRLDAAVFAAGSGLLLDGACIGGQLNMNGARITNPGETALSAIKLAVEQGMFCGEGFTAFGQVCIPSAHIGGELNMNGARITNPDGVALRADNLTVEELACLPLSGLRIL